MTDDTTNVKRLGPNSERKVAQILAAARDCFTDNGFSGTSMDAVAQLANVSKATVYVHFNSKSALFAAVIANEGAAFVLALEEYDDEDIEPTLSRFGAAAAGLFLAPHNIAVYRSIAAEAVRFPELGPIFFKAGPDYAIAQLSAFLRRAMDQQKLRHEDPKLAAAQFFGLVLGDLQLKSLVGMAASITNQERDVVVTSGVAAFLRAYRL